MKCDLCVVKGEVETQKIGLHICVTCIHFYCNGKSCSDLSDNFKPKGEIK